jgi:hypothetical protein
VQNPTKGTPNSAGAIGTANSTFGQITRPAGIALRAPYKPAKMLSATTARPQLAASFRPTAARNGQQLSRARAPLRLYATAEQQEERSLAQKLAAPAAAVLGAALLFGATPDMAEAARSGGRVGGSSGFSARRAAPPA